MTEVTEYTHLSKFTASLWRRDEVGMRLRINCYNEVEKHSIFDDRLESLFICEDLCVYSQSCLTLCNPMDCSLPESSVSGISQAGILEWVAIFFSNMKIFCILLIQSCVPQHTGVSEMSYRHQKY